MITSGNGRNFLRRAQGSLSELDAQLDIAVELGHTNLELRSEPDTLNLDPRRVEEALQSEIRNRPVFLSMPSRT